MKSDLPTPEAHWPTNTWEVKASIDFEALHSRLYKKANKGGDRSLDDNYTITLDDIKELFQDPTVNLEFPTNDEFIRKILVFFRTGYSVEKGPFTEIIIELELSPNNDMLSERAIQALEYYFELLLDRSYYYLDSLFPEEDGLVDHNIIVYKKNPDYSHSELLSIILGLGLLGNQGIEEDPPVISLVLAPDYLSIPDPSSLENFKMKLELGIKIVLHLLNWISWFHSNEEAKAGSKSVSINI